MARNILDKKKELVTRAAIAWRRWITSKGAFSSAYAEIAWHKACEDLLKWQLKHERTERHGEKSEQ